MDRFPALAAGAVLFEDEAIIAVDKPVFVPSQAVREGGDELPARVRRWLRERDGKDVSLGIHQRLDALTSGVVVFAKNEVGNRELASAFEGRTVVKRYLAVVHGRGQPPEGLLEDRLLHERGVTHVDARGEPSACTVTLVERLSLIHI